MSIATKTGDHGKTGLITGDRVLKTNARIQAVGSLDEINAHIGLVLSMKPENMDFLRQIQSDLFIMGAALANPKSEDDMQKELLALEHELEKVEATLPQLKNFILPGGTPLAAQIQVLRVVVRRAERHCIEIDPMPTQIMPYINRLSDYFFLLGRSVNLTANEPEPIWKP